MCDWINEQWLPQDSTAIEKKKKDLEKAESSLKKLTEDSERDKDAHLAAQRRLQAVNAGLSSNDDGQDASLNNQLMGNKHAAAAALSINFYQSKNVNFSQANIWQNWWCMVGSECMLELYIYILVLDEVDQT